MHEEFCMISDRPEMLKVDDQNRPHCEDGPFCRWRDGSALYSYHGVRVPGWIIESPERITLKDINAEDNAEVKRVMIEKYGVIQYMNDMGAVEIHSDRDTKGRRALYEMNREGMVLKMVKLENSTREKDGTRKPYFFRVPPEVNSCAEAVAWMYGVDVNMYRPHVET